MKNEKVEMAIENLNNGIKNVYNSEKWTEFLKFSAGFKDYSFSNKVLIFTQFPDAKLVAGFKTWEKKGRHVNKGEKGISILAPLMKKIKEENEKGEESENYINYGFKVVYVFDIAQTSGDDVPTICNKYTSTNGNYETFKNILSKISNYPIVYKDTESRANGYFSEAQNMIVVSDKLAQNQALKTTIHEITHSRLHKKEQFNYNENRNQAEIEAESTAFIVCNYFGIDCDNYSFEYVASWAQDKELKQLKASLETIENTAKSIIEEIENLLPKKEEKAA